MISARTAAHGWTERKVIRMADVLMWVAAIFFVLPIMALILMSVLVIVALVKMIIEEITGW